jgi:hypothetical protein
MYHKPRGILDRKTVNLIPYATHAVSNSVSYVKLTRKRSNKKIRS